MGGIENEEMGRRRSRRRGRSRMSSRGVGGNGAPHGQRQ